MGFLDKVGSFLKREAKDLGDAAEGAKDKIDQELTKREQELKMTPSQKIAALQQQAAATDSKFDAIADKATGQAAIADAMAEVGEFGAGELPSVTHIVLPDGSHKSGHELAGAGTASKPEIPVVEAPIILDEPVSDTYQPVPTMPPPSSMPSEPVPAAAEELPAPPAPVEPTASDLEDLPAPSAPAEDLAAEELPAPPAPVEPTASDLEDLPAPSAPAENLAAEELPAPPAPVEPTASDLEELPAPPAPIDAPEQQPIVSDSAVAEAAALLAAWPDPAGASAAAAAEELPAPPAPVAEELPAPPAPVEDLPAPPAPVAEELPAPPAALEDLPAPPTPVEPAPAAEVASEPLTESVPESVAEEAVPDPAPEPVAEEAVPAPAPAPAPVRAVPGPAPSVVDPSSPDYGKTPAQLKYERARAAANSLLDELRGELKEDGEI